FEVHRADAGVGRLASRNPICASLCAHFSEALSEGLLFFRLRPTSFSATDNQSEGDMTEERGRHELATKRLVYEIAGADTVAVRRDVQYRAADATASTMDIYYPPDAQRRARTPAVVIVAGYPDMGFEKFVGCKF